MAETRRQQYERLRSQLETERSSFIAHWRELGDFIQPRRARFTVSDANKGDRRSRHIIDSTATFAARTLSSGMMSGVTSPARPWFRLTTPDPGLAEFGPVKDWLHVVSQRMATVFLRSNLYNKLPTAYRDLGVFGTAAFSVLEDDESVIRCVDHPIGSYCIAHDDRLQVRVFTREFRMTVRQLVQRFGRARHGGTPDWSRFSRTVRNLWDTGSKDTWIDVCHVIVPNDDYDERRLESRFKRFRSVYYEKGADEDTLLEDAGFNEFPVLAPRWETTGEDVYGTDCPGMTALGDIKQLQLGEKRGMQAIDKMVNPPMVAPTSMRGGKASILPGDITYADVRDGMQGFRPAHEVNPRIQELEGKQQQVRYRIQRSFYEDLFLMLAQSDRREITAREIEERHEEKLLALGPMLEQLNQDGLDPLIDRTFAIMERRGMIPEAPEELQGVALKVEYISIMAQAQKLVGISGLERFAGFVGQMVQVTQDPTILDKVDTDQMIDEYGDALGVPPRLIVPDEQVAEMRQARAQQAQAERQAALAEQAAGAAQKLSQTDTSSKNALTDLLGTGVPAGL